MKQFLLTGYLEYLLRQNFTDTKMSNNLNSTNQGLPTVEIITPSDPKKRGSQLSINFSIPLANVQEELNKIGVVVSKHNDANSLNLELTKNIY